MLATPPSHFFQELEDSRLRVIAEALLDQRYATLRDLVSPYDDNYTREGTVFGRSRNLLIEMAKSGKYNWLTLKHPGMDVTVAIERVPCRFFRDDPEHPEKAGFHKRNAVDQLFDIDETKPVVWRFVIEQAMTDEDEDRVHFIGYNAFQEKVSQWMYRPSSPTMHAVDQDVPLSTILPPLQVNVRDDIQRADNDDRQAGTGI